ncbi:hypothetical protein ACFL1N_03675 [Thermodesulfobacteriota bacterium]
MRSKLLIVIAITILFITGACTPQGEESATAPPQEKEPVKVVNLDRQALVDLMTDYYDALVTKDQSKVPIAANIKFVENTAEIPVGDGLWVTASEGPGEFRIDAADPGAQQVASLAMMKEYEGENAFAGIRLKVVNGEITEAEHLVIRGDDLGVSNLVNLQKPRPGLLEDVPEAERMSREELIRIGLTYYDALTGEGGKLSPFAEECGRHENGMVTAGTQPMMPPPSDAGSPEGAAPPPDIDPEFAEMMERMADFPTDCEGQISTGTFAYITDIKERRVLVADVQKGLSVGFSMFWHRGHLKEMPIKGVEGVESVPAFSGTFNLPALHIYKIKNGKIYEIEATGFMMPYGVKSGW